MDIRMALHCAIQAARGLAAAHSKGIVHRDVKPSNLMINPEGKVRILDLGLARAFRPSNPFNGNASGDLTQKGDLIGTPDFLSPEQAREASAADARSDIYSLGATLHYLLTARPPFPAEFLLDRLLAHRERPAPSLKAERPELSEGIEEIYLRMMAKRPADRPGSMAEVAHALEACRSSAEEEETTGIDLLAYARRVFKKAQADARARRGPDRSGLDTDVARQRSDAPFDDDLRLEDAVADYRDAVHSDSLAEDLLPRLGYRAQAAGSRRYPLASFRLGMILTGFGIAVMGGIYALKAAVGILRYTPAKVVASNAPPPKPKVVEQVEAPKPQTVGIAVAKVPDPRPAPPKPPETPPPTANERIILARLEKPVRLNLRNARIIDLLMEIKRETIGPELPRGVPFFVDPLGFQEAKATVESPVSIRAAEEPLKDSLRDALSPLGLSFAVRGDRLLISSKALTDIRVVTGPRGVEAAMPRLETIVELNGFAYACSNLGLLSEAHEQYELALKLQLKRYAANSENDLDRGTLYLCYNNLSTHYSTYLDPVDRDPAQAVELAKEAVALKPQDSLGWENLGWALYSAGDWNGCIRAVEKSIIIDRRGTGYDWFFLAMAYKKLGNPTKAKGYYNQGVGWLRRMPTDSPLYRKARNLRDQAADVLGLKTAG